eukprot:m.31276 g.31276  ORF g.31276 m.31276 type:complete len:367 (+) comp8298_c0_seq1:215-1315(+)
MTTEREPSIAIPFPILKKKTDQSQIATAEHRTSRVSFDSIEDDVERKPKRKREKVPKIPPGARLCVYGSGCIKVNGYYAVARKYKNGQPEYYKIDREGNKLTRGKRAKITYTGTRWVILGHLTSVRYLRLFCIILFIGGFITFTLNAIDSTLRGLVTGLVIMGVALFLAVLIGPTFATVYESDETEDLPPQESAKWILRGNGREPLPRLLRMRFEIDENRRTRVFDVEDRDGRIGSLILNSVPSIRSYGLNGSTRYESNNGGSRGFNTIMEESGDESEGLLSDHYTEELNDRLVEIHGNGSGELAQVPRRASKSPSQEDEEQGEGQDERSGVYDGNDHTEMLLSEGKRKHKRFRFSDEFTAVSDIL